MLAGAAEANTVRNSYAYFSGEQVDIVSGGDFCYDQDASGDMVVTARPGWLINGSGSVTLSRRKGVGHCLKLQTALKEDKGRIHVFPYAGLGDHHYKIDPVEISAAAAAPDCVAMYAVPDSSAAVSIPLVSTVKRRGGVHRITRRLSPCACGEVYIGGEIVEIDHYSPDVFEWTCSRMVEGSEKGEKAEKVEKVDGSTWKGRLTKGKDQKLKFTVTGRSSAFPDCPDCTCTATTEVSADVFELSITGDKYIGLDMTDAKRNGRFTGQAYAKIDPSPGMASYKWIDCGKRCDWNSMLTGSGVSFFTTAAKGPSAYYREEPLTVEATVVRGERRVSATCTDHFTIVKVDVEMGGATEETEETKGSFVEGKHNWLKFYDTMIDDVADHDVNGHLNFQGNKKLERRRALRQKDMYGLTDERRRNMIPVVLSCKPTLPSSEKFKVEYTLGRLLRVDEQNNMLKEMREPLELSADEIGNGEFYLDGERWADPISNFESGLEPGAVASDGMLKDYVRISHPESNAVDMGRYTVACIATILAFCDKMPSSGSFGVNPELFEGSCLDFGRPEETAVDSQALNIFFKYIENEAHEPGDFDVHFYPDIRPRDFAAKCRLTWSQTDGPVQIPLKKPVIESNLLPRLELNGQGPTVMGCWHLLRNPRVDGTSNSHVYKYRLTAEYEGHELKSEAWVMLPRAGGEVSGWLANEVAANVDRAKKWLVNVKAACKEKGKSDAEADDFAKDDAWKYIASVCLDYQGVVASPTPRYCNNRSAYATLMGIVVARCKLSNLMYAIWGRSLGFKTDDLTLGAEWNALARKDYTDVVSYWDVIKGGWDSPSSQAAIEFGGLLFEAYQSEEDVVKLITKEAALKLRTEDDSKGLNDVNLWPNSTPSSGFAPPDVTSVLEKLKEGDKSSSDR